MDLKEIELTKNLKIIDGELLNKKILVSKNFKSQVGSLNWELITKHFVFYYEGKASEIVEYKATDRLTIIKTISSRLGDFFHDFIDALWFVKDNCCFCNQYFLELLTDKTVTITYKDIITSNSQDQFSYVNFTKEEIARHLENYFKIKGYQIEIDTRNKTAFEPSLGASGGIIPSPTDHIDYNHHRLYRALVFLGMVRKSGRAISKITFFMSLYECLFTSDDNIISKKIRERASSLLGGDKKARKTFKNVIVQAYDIRSRNVHGDIIEMPIEKIKKIVLDLDNYTREILNMIINMENNEVFTSTNSEESKLTFETFFDKLVGLSVQEKIIQETNKLKACVVKVIGTKIIPLNYQSKI